MWQAETYFVYKVWECFVLKKFDTDPMVYEYDLDHDVGFRAALIAEVLLPGLGLVSMIGPLAHNVLGLGLKLLRGAGLA